MKNKLNALRERFYESAFYKNAPRPVKWIIGSLSNNLGYKLLSLVLAILLWSYVISTNTSITRTKTISGLTAYINGQSTLADHKLALKEDPAKQLSGIAVTVEAPQADYSRVLSDNVLVTLDLSNVRTAGNQQVPLRATTSYGRVRSISPSTLTLGFESLDSRNVSINTEFANAQKGLWYNVTRCNPSVLSVSGASSVVQSIASAKVVVDVAGLENSTIKALPYVLLDAAGEEISQTMLNCSTSSISVNLEIYPSRDIPVSTEYANVLTGQPAPGYVVQSVSIQPESLQVAAEKDLLEGLTELRIEPVSIEGASQSFSARAAVSQLSDFKNISSEQVYVSVNITEETISGYVEDVDVQFIGLGEGLVATYEPFSVLATGTRSAVGALMEAGVTVDIDLTGLEAGAYMLEPSVDGALYPNITFQCDTASVTLTGTDPEGPGDED